MWGKKNQLEDRVRIIEHLKTFCWQIIDMYQEGSGPGAMEPMTPALAKTMIGDEISRQLSLDAKPNGPSPAHLRIAGVNKILILNLLTKWGDDVLAVRWIGPRSEGDQTVAYVTIRCSSFEQFFARLLHIEKSELEVRDGTYGIFLK